MNLLAVLAYEAGQKIAFVAAIGTSLTFFTPWLMCLGFHVNCVFDCHFFLMLLIFVLPPLVTS